MATEITAAQRARAENNVMKARVQLILHQPFFASIVLRRTIRLDDAVSTAYVTPTGNITVGTEFAAKLTVQEVVFLLAHEAMHYAMLHNLRRSWRNPRAWNIACDKVINDILVEAKCGQAPSDGVFQPGAAAHAAEEIYQESDSGKGGGSYQPGTGQDDLSDDGEQQIDEEQIQQIRAELQEAAMAAKKVGKLPQCLDRHISDVINPATPWYQLLERFMLLQVKSGVSYRRPNRRFIAQDIYLPSQGTIPRMGTMVVQIDESGSIGERESAHMFGHINKMLETCIPERLIVLHTDTVVAGHEEYAPEDWPVPTIRKAGGGTDMTAGFRWCEEEGIVPDVFVCLTDGYTPFGDPPGYPMVWLITTKGIEAPHGETIFYEVDE